MSHLPLEFRAKLRLFAFWLGNGTLDQELLPGGRDYLDPADPGLGSMLEMTFAIFTNVIDIDEHGKVTNASQAKQRAAQYIRSYCDPSYDVQPHSKSGRWSSICELA